MEPTPPQKISTSLALQGLREASEAVWELERQLAEARAVRDALIADAVQDVSITRISQITKLSRPAIYRISPGKVRDDD